MDEAALDDAGHGGRSKRLPKTTTLAARNVGENVNMKAKEKGYA